MLVLSFMGTSGENEFNQAFLSLFFFQKQTKIFRIVIILLHGNWKYSQKTRWNRASAVFSGLPPRPAWQVRKQSHDLCIVHHFWKMLVVWNPAILISPTLLHYSHPDWFVLFHVIFFTLFTKKKSYCILIAMLSLQKIVSNTAVCYQAEYFFLYPV